MADQRSKHPRRPHRTGCAVTAKSIVLPAVPLFPQETGTASAIFSYDLSRENAKTGSPQAARFCSIQMIFPLNMPSNDDDRRQRRKQGGVVGAAASKTRVPPKARCGCWVPQPGSSGGHSKSSCFKESCCKMASLRRQLRGTWRCCRAMDFLRYLRLFGEKNCCGFDFLAVFM